MISNLKSTLSQLRDRDGNYQEFYFKMDLKISLFDVLI